MPRLMLLVALAIACGPNAAPRPAATPAPTPTTAHPREHAFLSDEVMPLWSQVRRGVLPNGLTYYVMPHGKPEKRASLWLAVNAGALSEDDDQRGLAHFVEHMAFNGTKRFPKQNLVNYIEGIGMKFGADLNAYTSFDETVYQLQVPTDDAAAVTKGFEILRDWTSDITFDPGEVDKERGVVLEEWRLGRGAGQRLLDKLLPALFGNWRYATRLPIGLPAIIEKAPREKLVQFYKDWYRPDLMAVIAVGDFADPAAIERQIKETFGDLPAATTRRPSPKVGAPALKGSKVAVVSDHELPISAVVIANLVDHRGQRTRSDLRAGLAERLYQAMLNERLQTIARRPDAPFASAGIMVQSVVRGVDVFGRFALIKNNDTDAAVRSLMVEVTRAERHGFTASELERARAVLMRGFEQNAAEEATRDGRTFTEELVRNFLDGEFVVGSTRELELVKQLLPGITLAELRTAASRFGGVDTRLVLVAGPDGKPLPTEAHVLEVVAQVQVPEPWKDEAVASELMKPPAWPGTVEQERKLESLGVTEWKLANGVRVLVKPTDFERDTVMIQGSSPGGLAMASAADYPHARFADEIVGQSGAGQLDADALEKALAGKHVAVTADIRGTTESIEGSGSARDLETMLQLIHLRMTAPRRDERAFTVWKANTIEVLANLSRAPDAEFQRRMQAALWKNHPRHLRAEVADLQRVDLDKAFAFYRDRYGDASDFTFVIAGVVDVAKLKPLVEAYLGSLPGSRRVEKERDLGDRRVGGVVKEAWKLGQDKDQAHVELVFHGDDTWTRDAERDMFVLEQVAALRLHDVLREELSGVYGVGANGDLARSPHQERVFAIQFGCAPGAVDKLVDATYAELATIAKSGIGEEYLVKVRQGFVRERETAMRTNPYWIDWLSRSARFGDDPTIVLDPAPVLARMTSDRVKASAQRWLDRKRVFRAVMLPK
jgi:zinc protease